MFVKRLARFGVLGLLLALLSVGCQPPRVAVETSLSNPTAPTTPTQQTISPPLSLTSQATLTAKSLTQTGPSSHSLKPAAKSPIASFSATPAATRTSVPSATPSATARPSETPTPPPAPTATLDLPVERQRAEQAMQDGAYAEAIPLWEALLADPALPERGSAVLALARAYSEENRPQDAIAQLAQALTGTLSAEQTGEALGLLARAYESLGEWRAAIDAYNRYLEHEPSVATEVRWQIVKDYVALQDYAQAEQQLLALPLDSLAAAQRAEMLEELASVRRQMKNYDGALEAYDRILSFATRAEYQAVILQKKGETLREAGRNDKAVALFSRVVQEYATTSTAYQALTALDELGAAQVSDLQRGEILYSAGQYAPCIEALQRHLASSPNDQPTKAYYYMGLAYTRLGQYEPAFQAFDTVIEQYPQDGLIADVWFAKARAAAANGGDPSGLYHEFATRYPDHARAPSALWSGAVALERAQEWERAASYYQELRTKYPNDSSAPEALFREGLMAYARQDMATATARWSEALATTPSGAARARVLTWLGLAARAAGDTAAASNHWQAAFNAAPQSYYGVRAQDLKTGGVSLSWPATLPPVKLEQGWSVNWQALTTWIEGWAPAPETASDLEQNTLARRGVAFFQLGWYGEAASALRALRDQVKDSPRDLLALARFSDRLGVRSVAIACAERLLVLGQQQGAGEPPEALLKLAYPAYFGHLVNAEAQTWAVDPLLFLALMRQESRFDPWAVSYAGATGLTQVMPETGKWIASQIGPNGYRHDLLYRPALSIRFGVWYFAKTIEMYGRDWIAGLVGYNAGPGNVKRWANGSAIADHDLFYELLPIKQPQDYVTQIYRFYRIYEQLYR